MPYDSEKLHHVFDMSLEKQEMIPKERHLHYQSPFDRELRRDAQGTDSILDTMTKSETRVKQL